MPDNTTISTREYHSLTKEIIRFKEYFDIVQPGLGNEYAKVYTLLKQKFNHIEIEVIQQMFIWSTDSELNCLNDVRTTPLAKIIKYIKWSSICRIQGVSYERHGYTKKHHWRLDDI